MKEVKTIFISIFLIFLGLFIYKSDFLVSLRAAKPSAPWWNMGTWFYYSALMYHEGCAILAILLGFWIILIIAVREVKRLFCKFWIIKNFIQ